MERMKERLPASLIQLKERIFQPLKTVLTNFTLSRESTEYDACSFNLGENKILYRQGKITPSKTGQFVTIWKRDQHGITVPYHIGDDIQSIIIAVNKNRYSGYFIFPTSILADKGILSHNGKDGKRGIRIYPPWDAVSNRMAEKTRGWQSNYFLSAREPIQLHKAKQLLQNLK